MLTSQPLLLSSICCLLIDPLEYCAPKFFDVLLCVRPQPRIRDRLEYLVLLPAESPAEFNVRRI